MTLCTVGFKRNDCLRFRRNNLQLFFCPPLYRLWLSTSGAKPRPFDVTGFSLAVSYKAVDVHGQCNMWPNEC